MFAKGYVQVIEENGYTVCSSLGKGGFAECLRVFSKKYKQYFACKVIPIAGQKSDSRKRSFENELNVLMNIIHPNVIQIYQTFSSATHLFLILEFCPNGDMQKYVVKNGAMKNETVLLNYISKILDCLAYLEGIGIAHKDIKPSNIFIDKHGRPKLADFGLASFVGEDRLSVDYAGSLAFCSPEVLAMKPHDPFKADVWSFGVTLYYLATGKYPFYANGRKDILKLIMGETYTIPFDMNETIRNIIRNCLQIDPSKRMSFAQMKLIVDNEIEKQQPIEQHVYININKIKSMENIIVIPRAKQNRVRSITPCPSHSKVVYCKK